MLRFLENVIAFFDPHNLTNKQNALKKSILQFDGKNSVFAVKITNYQVFEDLHSQWINSTNRNLAIDRERIQRFSKTGI